MDIFVNGEAFADAAFADAASAVNAGGASTKARTRYESLGEALAKADDLLEKAGSIIVGLVVDGREIDADSYASIKDLSMARIGRVDITAETSAGIRAKTLATLLELLTLAGEASVPPNARGTKNGEAPADWAAIGHGASELAEAFAGLFPADELSYVQSFSELIERASTETRAAKDSGNPSVAPKAETMREIGELTNRLAAIFSERRAEIADPVAEMRKTAALYDRHTAELLELPVLLQTGKEERAMRAVLLFIEIFNKVIRLMPELTRLGLDSNLVRIGDLALPEFYSSFNEILRKLSAAFEDKDAVLIGDLAEYEVAPRMAELFAAIEDAMRKI